MINKIKKLNIKSKRDIKNLKGISLVEILVASSIMLILISFSSSSFVSLFEFNVLDKSTLTLAETIREARSMATSGSGNSSYGIRINSTSTIIFKGPSYTSSSTNITLPLDPRVEVSTTTLFGGGTDIIFGKILGTTSNYGTTSIRLKNDTNKYKNITINKNGIVNIK